MKTAPFAYARPGSVADAVAELAAGAGEDAKVLAGGQSLMPVLAMRLGRPGVLVDINAVPELAAITLARTPDADPARTPDADPARDPDADPARDPDADPARDPARTRAKSGYITIGATVRQRDAQEHPATAAVPLLRLALPWVGHREIRGRGTVCGSLAHADPAAELPAVARCLGAVMSVVSRRGRRSVAARDFFAGSLTTVLEPDELLESVSFPVAEPGDGYGFAEVARRHGDFALAGVAVRVRPGGAASVACFGIADRPVTRDLPPGTASAVASGNRPAAGDLAAGLVTTGDAQGTIAYRRRLIRELIAAELARATAGSQAGGTA